MKAVLRTFLSVVHRKSIFLLRFALKILIQDEPVALAVRSLVMILDFSVVAFLGCVVEVVAWQGTVHFSDFFHWFHWRGRALLLCEAKKSFKRTKPFHPWDSFWSRLWRARCEAAWRTLLLQLHYRKSFAFINSSRVQKLQLCQLADNRQSVGRKVLKKLLRLSSKVQHGSERDIDRYQIPNFHKITCTPDNPHRCNSEAWLDRAGCRANSNICWRPKSIAILAIKSVLFSMWPLHTHRILGKHQQRFSSSRFRSEN